MNGHEKVAQLVDVGGGFFEITRKIGDTLRVFVCECYAFGVAEFSEVQDHCSNVSAIVVSSNWCGYTDDVKAHCATLKVGVFTISEFMGALNRDDYWSYVVPDRKRL
jgi:hypothetical protein